MGLCRLLYNNLITAASMFTVSSSRNGLVTSALKEGSGSASLNPSGNFSGTEDLEYIVEIDSIAAGAEVGQATFKWSAGGGSWDATGVTTDSAPVLLNNGVYVSFASGSGDDFAVGDKWYFKGINFFNSERMLYLNRDSRYRSAELESPNTITIDLGSAQEVKALIIYDHNFTSAVTLTLKGDATGANWAAPDFSENVSYNAEKILHYLSAATTKRYWRLEITDAANPDTYIDIGEFVLLVYLELSVNFSYGASRDIESILRKGKTGYGIEKRRFYNLQKVFRYSLDYITDSDIGSLETLMAAITDRDTGEIDPIFFNEDSASPGDFWMTDLESLPRKFHPHDYNTTELVMREVLKSV